MNIGKKQRVRERRTLGKSGTGLRVGMVVSRFHPEIADRLVNGAVGVLEREGVQTIERVDVPGAFEVPGVAKQMGRSGQFDVILCLGVVIRGETDHYHYICSAVSHGLTQVALEVGKPVIFGLLTTLSVQQAIARSTGPQNKGRACAQTAVVMGQLYKQWKR